MKRLIKYAAYSILVFHGFGCGRVEQDSALDGHVAAGSFPATPTSIEARSQDGTLVQVSLASDGSFHLPLKPGTYSVSLVMGDTREPLVFPRKSGQVDTYFTVTSANASVNLGEIRHLTSVPAAGFQMMSSATCAGDAVCIDDDSAASCESEEDDDGNEQEGEHQDKDVRDEPETNATEPMATETIAGAVAIAEHNVPAQIGCDESEEEHDD